MIWYRLQLAFWRLVGVVFFFFCVALSAKNMNPYPIYTDLEVIAATIALEAAGEGPRGWAAVAEVIRNRAKKNKTTLRSECQRPHQFAIDGLLSAREFRQAKDNAGEYWQTILLFARAAHDGNLIPQLDGATHFYSGNDVPKWAKDMTVTARIGRHTFLKE